MKGKYATEEQIAYARVLEIGMRVSLVLLVVTFAAYMFGLVTPGIPASEMPKYWSMSASDYLHARDIPAHGWPWFRQLVMGDLVFAGIGLMALVTIYCYLYFLRFPLRNRDRVMTVIVVGECIVLALAASGLLAVGH